MSTPTEGRIVGTRGEGEHQLARHQCRSVSYPMSFMPPPPLRRPSIPFLEPPMFSLPSSPVFRPNSLDKKNQDHKMHRCKLLREDMNSPMVSSARTSTIWRPCDEFSARSSGTESPLSTTAGSTLISVLKSTSSSAVCLQQESNTSTPNHRKTARVQSFGRYDNDESPCSEEHLQFKLNL